MANLTYTQLMQAIADLEIKSAREAEQIRVRATRISEISSDTCRTAETLSVLAVDPYTVAETKEIAQAFGSIYNHALGYAEASETSAKSAKAVADQARRTHAGIKEQVGRSPVDISGVNRQWLTQE